jgi:hypothetical protein
VTIASLIVATITIPAIYMINPTVSLLVNFLSMTSIFILSGLVGSSLVFCASMWLPNQDIAFLVSAGNVSTMLAVSGGFLPFTSMPLVPSAIQWLSSIKYSYQAYLISGLTGTSAEKVIDIGGYNTPPTISQNLLILLGIFILVNALSTIGMTRIKEIR